MLVACATDRNYVEITGVMLSSVISHGCIPEARIVVFGDRLSDRDRNQLSRCTDGRADFVEIGGDVRRRIAKFPTTRKWPLATYIRLLAPEIIQDHGRMLYLDGDTLIRESVRDLFSVDMAGRTLGASSHRPGDTFNAGVLLIDLPAWRGRKYTEQTLHWLDENPEATMQDQEALNAVFAGNFLDLGPRFNSKCYGNGAAAHLIRNAAIIHFTGAKKPTDSDCPHAAHDLFVRQRYTTPWGDKPLRSPFKRRAQRFIQRLIRITSAAPKSL